jgi:hypothetical protein
LDKDEIKRSKLKLAIEILLLDLVMVVGALWKARVSVRVKVGIRVKG